MWSFLTHGYFPWRFLPLVEHLFPSSIIPPSWENQFCLSTRIIDHITVTFPRLHKQRIGFSHRVGRDLGHVSFGFTSLLKKASELVLWTVTLQNWSESTEDTKGDLYTHYQLKVLLCSHELRYGNCSGVCVQNLPQGNIRSISGIRKTWGNVRNFLCQNVFICVGMGSYEFPRTCSQSPNVPTLSAHAWPCKRRNREAKGRKQLKCSTSAGLNLNSLELTDVKVRLFKNFLPAKRQYYKPLQDTILHTIQNTVQSAFCKRNTLQHRM